MARTYLNDADPAVYAFWQRCRNESDTLCRLVQDTPLTMPEWHWQRRALTDPNSTLLARGFAAFSSTRTNRAGILLGGVMGGKHQAGELSLGDRFNREDLARRIKKIGYYRDRLEVTNLDAVDFLAQVSPKLTDHSLIYPDRPTTRKASRFMG